jgi:hypothetical protein
MLLGQQERTDVCCGEPSALALAEVLSGESQATPAKVRTVDAHARGVREDDVGEAESTRSSMRHVTVPNSQAQGLTADQR